LDRGTAFTLGENRRTGLAIKHGALGCTRYWESDPVRAAGGGGGKTDGKTRGNSKKTRRSRRAGQTGGGTKGEITAETDCVKRPREMSKEQEGRSLGGGLNTLTADLEKACSMGITNTKN